MKKNILAVLGVLLLGILSILYPLSTIRAESENANQNKEIGNKNEVVSQKLLEEFGFENQQRTNETFPTEAVQEFSFETKTFKTIVGQPVVLKFTSRQEADQVLVRIPEEGQILETHFAKGESIEHSHGEYWLLHTKEQQTSFELPVLFEAAGNYFLTIDHDADHFYLEVEGDTHKINSDLIEELEEQHEDEQMAEEKEVKDDVIESQAVIAKEENLTITEESVVKEEERILETITDAENRSSVSVSNWSQFRTAWNNSARTEIVLTADLQHSSSILSSLNSRSSNVEVRSQVNGGYGIQFYNTTENLKITGSATVTFSNVNPTHDFSSVIAIEQSGSGKVIITNESTVIGRGSGVQADNLLIENGGTVIGFNSVGATVFETLEIFSNNSSLTGISSGLSMQGKNVYIKGNDFLLRSSSIRQSWTTVDLHLTNGHGSVINSAVTTPDDFSERYPSSGLSNWSHIYLNGRNASDWVDPPLPSYTLSFQAIPSEGGLPTSDSATITQETTTEIHANPNEGYQFVKWEIISGTDASIADETAETTTFTMGTTDAVVSAVYEEVPVIRDAVLTVEFVNELDQLLPGYTVTIEDYLIGDEVDLTKNQAVINQLTALESAGYEIAERPANETAILLDEAEVTVRYKIQGVLSLASAPNSLDFGTLVYDATTQCVEDPTIDQPLIVTDTRAEAENGWRLTATLSTPMKTDDGKELVNALRYVYQGQETILDTNAQTVYLNTAGSAGSFNVSNSWGNQTGTDGAKLQISSSDIVHTGSYTGVITWKVMAGQP